MWATEIDRDATLWSKLAELGVCGAFVPDAQGGMGLDERDLVLLLEETGRAALPAPVVATAAVGAPLLRDAGNAALADAWLPRVAAGDAILAVGHPADPFVADAGVADLLLLAHGDEVHALERAAATLTHQPANDPARRLYSVAWTPSAATCIASGDAARRLLDAALDRGALACAAQALGVAEQLLDLAVAYAKQREQFGRAIGSFQALQHKLADVKVKLEYARPVVYKAAHSVATHEPRARRRRLAREARRDGGGELRRAHRAASARRDRLHLGTGPAPVDAARLVARARLRRRGVPSRSRVGLRARGRRSDRTRPQLPTTE